MKTVFEILKKIENAGYKAYIVGGFTRDFLLGLNNPDIDIATNAHCSIIEKLFTVIDDKGKIYSSIKIKYKDINAEISTFRKEEYTKKKMYPSKVSFVDTIEEDCLRRDFTINAIYIDSNEKIYDFVAGQKDLSNKILRFIGNAELRINEDPTRILRGLRFAIKYNLIIEEDTRAAFIKNMNLIKLITNKKLSAEIYRLYSENDIEQVNLVLCKYGLLKVLFGFDDVFFIKGMSVTLSNINEKLEKQV